MILIHVLRKTFQPNLRIVDNLIQNGTGCINIDAARIQVSNPSTGGAISGASALGQTSGWNAHANKTTPIDRNLSKGRWPPNLILQHGPECQNIGTIQAPATSILQGQTNTCKRQTSVLSPKKGRFTVGTTQPVTGFANENGTEEIEHWDCNCHVQQLDQVHGTHTTSKNCIKKSSSKTQQGNIGAAFGKESRGENTPMITYGDTGYVSRFYKQISNYTKSVV